MEKFRVLVKVKLKDSIKDVKGQTIEQAAKNLLHTDEFKVRVGNIYKLEFQAKNEQEAEKMVHEICEEILANSTIEEYEILWEK